MGPSVFQLACSCNIHPNKDLAAKLHAKNPEQFTDDNHKPEIAIALGPFEVFAGWKPQAEIDSLFEALPPLQKFLPKKDAKVDNETLRTVVQTILQSSDESIKKCQQELAKIPKEKYGKQSYILEILPRLQEQYSIEDPGNLVALITMNFLTLSTGDAIYVPADAPHAYLSGNIVECMARSNNVLNTGFCPRADRDNIELFSSALTFAPHSAEEVLLPSKPSKRGKEGKTVEYAPPMSEFNMLKTELKGGEKEVVEKIAGPSVLFSMSGQGKMSAGGEEFEVKEGYIFFVGQGVEVHMEAEKGLVVYRAYAE
ncbi:mannose-6-phosphate isomerase, partial [Lecanoromycetidae sp. Uapishka_2]